MFELVLRVVLASGAMAASGILGRPDFDLTWRASLFFAAYSYLVYLMEQKGSRNAGVSGLVAVADCGVVAVFLANLGVMTELGALSALPMVWAFFKHKANAAMMSPMVASWLLVGANMFGGGNAFTTGLLLQALGILVVGIVMHYVRNMVEERKEITTKVEPEPEPTEEVTLADIGRRIKEEEEAERTIPVDAQEYIEFRENFRELTESARVLEKSSKRDKAVLQLFEGVVREKNNPFGALSKKICELTEAEGINIYTVSDSGDTLVSRTSAGAVEDAIQNSSIDVPRSSTESELGEIVHSNISSLINPTSKTKFVSLILKVRGKLTGILTLFHTSAIELEASVRRAEETSDFIAELISDQISRADDRRKMREAELLYSVATTSSGATTAAAIAERVIRELFETLRLDHLSVSFLDGFEPTELTTQGRSISLIGDITLSQGRGIKGWIEAGSPTIIMKNARDDSRLPAHEALKKRVGSFVLIPLEFGAEPMGYITAATSLVGGIDTGEIETLRVIAAELSQALARIENKQGGPEGLATPKEFFEIIKESQDGHLVYLEVPQREELCEIYGRPAMAHATRRFAVRLRSKLPTGAAVCRRNEEDYVVFLPSSNEQYVRSWANDVAALASMIGVRTPDGRSRIPLAIRAKVAPVSQQKHRISTEQAA